MSRPYFETKVVKVKKEKAKCRHIGIVHPWNITSDTIKCDKCGELFILGRQDEKPKGNWLNGENLDKIKFPCFCSYKLGGKKRIGQLNAAFFRGDYYYILTDESQQYNDTNCEPFYNITNLELLFKNYDIHILKGKIIIFEEE